MIFYLWRYLCALSIQDYLLFAIFIDRTWVCLEVVSIDKVRFLFSLRNLYKKQVQLVGVFYY